MKRYWGLSVKEMGYLNTSLDWILASACFYQLTLVCCTSNNIQSNIYSNNAFAASKSEMVNHPKKIKINFQTRRECDPFNTHYLKFFMSLFCIITWGAFLRWILRTSGLFIPYTVLLMITGILIGLGTYTSAYTSWDIGCVYWSMYTKIGRMPPQVLLYVFLPILLFEAGFSLDPHVLLRSLPQILMVALPGMLITTYLLALATRYVFNPYAWDFSTASLFGAIASASDPVAVVSILKELRTMEALTTILKGESLVNTGLSVLLYKIYAPIIVAPPSGNLGLHIFLKVLQIGLGGPAFGFFMAKVTAFFLSLIFNDATVEITITIVSAYLTYYIGDAFLGVTGIVPTVALGMMMSWERTSISPAIEALVRHFWKILAYLATTVLFTIVGILMSETSISSFQITDLTYLAFLYFALILIRFLMLIVISPFMGYLGYGFPPKSMVVMTLCGIRGAVGICLAFQIYTKPDLCHLPSIGPKFLLQMAGLTLLTLTVNGTTSQVLLKYLGARQISIGRMQGVKNAFNQVTEAQARTIATLKNDSFLGDAKWEFVERYTTIENPYAQKKDAKTISEYPPLFISNFTRHSTGQIIVYDEDSGMDTAEPNTEEYTQTMEEARLGCLKALKTSFWRQYKQGTLSETGVQILRKAAYEEEKQPGQLNLTEGLRKFWILEGVFPWMQNYFTRKLPSVPFMTRMTGSHVNKQAFLGNDLGKAFVTATEEVMRFLPQIVSHPKILKMLRTALENERLEAVREIGLLQNQLPEVATAAKTVHASRSVLNQMQDALDELKEEGMIDDKENTLLRLALEEKMKKLLWHCPSTVPSSPPETVLENLPWVIGDNEILEYIKMHSRLMSFSPGVIIYKDGASPNGIHILVSGMIKVHYVPKEDVIKKYEKYGVVPNSDIFRDLTYHFESAEYFTTGEVLGEKGVLTNEARCATATCETAVTAFHIPQMAMKAALSIFAYKNMSLESKMWRAYGIKLAMAFLPTQPAYSTWTLDKIRMHLESSEVPIAKAFEAITVQEHTYTIILIQGRVMNVHTKNIYKAPSLVPVRCSKLAAVEGEKVHPRVLLVSQSQDEQMHGNTK